MLSRRLIGFGVAVLLLSGICVGARAQALSLEGDQVVRRKLPLGFEVQKKFIRYGKATNEGMCAFESQLSVRPGESIEEIELEYDRLTCRSLVVQGKSSDAVEGGSGVPERAPKAKGSPSGSTGSLPSFPPSGSAAASGPTYWAAYRTWFRDPIYITLNEVQSKVWWRPVSGCASGDYVNYEPSFDWLEATGWFKVSSGDKRAADCTSVNLNANAVYQSDSFPTCIVGNPQTLYDENYVQGNADGSATGYSKTRRAGQKLLCTNLWTENKKLTSGVSETVKLAGALGCSGSDPALFFKLDVPFGGSGSFSTTSSGSDYNGTPLYFQVSGAIANAAVSSDVAIYLDPAYSQHVRTDHCEGPIANGSFRDDSCVLVRDTSAGCVPIWMSLDAAKDQGAAGQLSMKARAKMPLHVPR